MGSAMKYEIEKKKWNIWKVDPTTSHGNHMQN